ncbi:MAG: TRAP transporter TatT component family protein [Woeseiaceae bacterium]|nr:TRAP transporter TatT component family protein [Woeseiaceae bacterium]
MYDQELHDRLLQEILAAEAEVPGYTLTNVLAQRDARVLLESGADYF